MQYFIIISKKHMILSDFYNGINYATYLRNS